MSKDLKSYDYCKETVALYKNLEEGFLVLGERLKKIRDGELYKGSWESFADYLLEVRTTESKASKLITVYETYAEKYGFSAKEIVEAGGWSLLYEAARHITSKTHAKEVLHELTHRHEKDGRIFIQELKSGISQDKCKHTDSYTIVVCRTCGAKVRNHDND